MRIFQYGRTRIITGAALSVLACADALAQSPAADASLSSTRQSVVKQLQNDGVVYSYTLFGTSLEKQLEKLTAKMAEVAVDPADAAFRQDYRALARDLGLTQLAGVGYSSAPRGDGFENRLFFSVPGKRVGVWTLFGGKPHAFETAKYAPADADLFLESDVELDEMVKSLLTVFARVSPEKASEYTLDKLVQSDSSGVFRTLLTLKGRMTFVLRSGALRPAAASRAEAELAASASEPSPRTLALFARVEGIGDSIRKSMEKSQTWTSSKEGKLELFTLPEIEGELFRPIVAIEGKTVYFALNEAFLRECLSRSGESLANSPAYTEALAQMGTTGNSVSYLSPRFFDFLRETLNDFKTDPVFRLASRNQGAGLVDYLLDQIPQASHPFVSVSTNLDDGILLRSWAPRSYSTSQFAINLINPELFGDVVSAGVVAVFDQTKTERAQKVAKGAIEENLKKIDAQAQAYFASHPEEQEVSMAQLIEANPTLESLPTHAGENYADLVIRKASDVIEVLTANAEIARYVRPLTEEQISKIRQNLALFDEAAVLHFMKNPETETMGAYDAMSHDSRIPEALIPIVGESYSGVYLSKNDTEIEITTPGEQRVAYTRDPQIKWTALKRALLKESRLVEQLRPAFEAAQSFFAEQAKPNATTDEDVIAADPVTSVSLATLVEAKRVSRPEGISEDDAYSIVFQPNIYAITGSIGGESIRVIMPLPAATQEKVASNLARITKALGEYLAKNPNEPAVFASEIAGKSKLLPHLPEAVVGEDYGLVSLRRGDSAVSFELPTGHILTAPAAAK